VPSAGRSGGVQRGHVRGELRRAGHGQGAATLFVAADDAGHDALADGHVEVGAWQAMHRKIAIGGQDLTEFIPHRVGDQPFASTDLDQRNSPTGRGAHTDRCDAGRSAVTRRVSPIAGPETGAASRCQTQERCLPRREPPAQTGRP
jgi:hypothetical protein